MMVFTIKAMEKASNKLLKATNPDLYYSTLYMEYYQCVKQYKNHVAIAKAKGHKHEQYTLFFEKKICLSPLVATYILN